MKNERQGRGRPYEPPCITTISGKELFEKLGPALASIYDLPWGW